MENTIQVGAGYFFPLAKLIQSDVYAVDSELPIDLTAVVGGTLQRKRRKNCASVPFLRKLIHQLVGMNDIPTGKVVTVPEVRDVLRFNGMVKDQHRLSEQPSVLQILWALAAEVGEGIAVVHLKAAIRGKG